jgi:pimeloyl-ACP methyl ester carboxylesterase
MRVSILIFGVSLISLAFVGQAASSSKPGSFDPYIGIYKLNSNDYVSIAKFDLGDGEKRLLFTDFKSGTTRILSFVSENKFTAGTGFLLNPPVEIQLTFSRDRHNEVSSLVWQQNGYANRIADKTNLNREEVTFQNGEVRLSGTLISPATSGSHGAVVLLHGSGALDRYSFGPFPDFFLSHGFAVLIYDKRGTGASTGDLAHSTLDDLAQDGQAAVAFIKHYRNINSGQIGLCGPSQGGFLAASVASGNRDIAFLINLYGMYVPVWQQELFRADAEMRVDGLSENEIVEALAFTKLEFDVGRTGQDWDRFAASMQQAKDKKWFTYVPHSFSDLNELRYYWKTLYSYDPTPALEKVTCPVLALFGELDKSTPVPETIANMDRALKKAGTNGFTFKVFPKGIHGLLEGETGANSEIPRLKRFVPGFFETMTDWLRQRGFITTHE